MTEINIVLFTNNLRLHDNTTIHKAQHEQEPWLGIYCFKPQLYQKWLGMQRSTPRRRKWLLDAVKHLKQTIEQKGGQLYIHKGTPQQALQNIRKEHKIKKIFIEKEPGTEEQELRQKLRQQYIVETTHTTWLYNPEHTRISPENTPHTFTQFKKQVQKHNVKNPLPPPKEIHGTTITLPEPTPDKEIIQGNPTTPNQTNIPFEPTEKAALQRLQTYTWDKKLPKTYKKTRNKLQGKNTTTKYSIWLAHGAISPKKIYYETTQFEKQHGSNKSTYWIKFELTWREFFRYQYRKHKENLYKKQGIKQKNIPWTTNKKRLRAFKNAQTGYPLIDAAIKELEQTGYMSNRARQNVASFFTKNLHLDWRLGAAIFEKHLVDYDTASNYGNWQYNASIGNDSRPYRYFNIIKQSKRYNAANYIKTWIPELQHIPNKHVHTPWMYNQQTLTKPKKWYPEPIVPFRESINTFKQKF